jgi:NADH:ubiquinone oxidoreductase subunit F (NADH-binding)
MSSLLSGPAPTDGLEPLASHLGRLGARPRGAAELIGVLERSELRGRGGGGFPVGTKWATVVRASGGPRTVLVNGAEGEPLCRKDRTLMEARPHLVLDGAALAAECIGATDVVLYVGEDHAAARSAMRRALAERPASEQRHTRLVGAPPRYVAGEETAAVHLINDGVALPITSPPRPYQSGVGGGPTLVQNVETLAHVAMIARFGDGWFRALGHTSPGTVLLTVSGAVARPGVMEVAHGTTIADAVATAGGATATPRAVLLGGYFGCWIDGAEAAAMTLDSAALRASGRTLGCGVLAVLPESGCGVLETSRVLAYLADESARQCGPCVFGLRAIAQAVDRIATGRAEPNDLARAGRWAAQLRGRGACHHPDGAAGLLASAMNVFAAEFELHQSHRRCSVAAPRTIAA